MQAPKIVSAKLSENTVTAKLFIFLEGGRVIVLGTDIISNKEYT
jgi:hypothetical protein